jgi:AraC-like DNA-binding protein
VKPSANNSVQGILHAEVGKQKFRLTRYAPADDLKYLIERYWVTEWDLRGQDPYSQIILAHPNINMVIEPNNTRIYGIAKTTTSHLLQGQGRVIGIKFRLGGFYPFWEQPISKLAGQSIDSRDIFGEDARTLEDEVLATDDEEQKVLLLESFLRARLPKHDGNVELVNRMIDTMVADREMLKVDDIVDRFNINKRTLQRLFNRYVGTSPKWVLQRYRLHDAASRIESGEVVDWSRLSLELGYYDQAHFIKDFKAIIGNSPEEYIKGPGQLMKEFPGLSNTD